MVDDTATLKVWTFRNCLIVRAAAKLSFLAYDCFSTFKYQFIVLYLTILITSTSLLLFLISCWSLAISTTTKSSFFAWDAVLFIFSDCLCIAIVTTSKSKKNIIGGYALEDSLVGRAIYLVFSHGKSSSQPVKLFPLAAVLLSLQQPYSVSEQLGILHPLR